MEHLVFEKCVCYSRQNIQVGTTFRVLNVTDIKKPTYTVCMIGEATYDDITTYLKEHEQATSVDVCGPWEWSDFQKDYTFGSSMPKKKKKRVEKEAAEA